jgi:hypothetical protein
MPGQKAPRQLPGLKQKQAGGAEHLAIEVKDAFEKLFRNVMKANVDGMVLLATAARGQNSSGSAGTKA